MRMEEVLRRALKIVKPSPEEEERLRKTAKTLLAEVGEEVEKVEGVVGISLEGSAAKGTWVRGREEADIFVHFEPSISKDKMEEEIISLGFRVVGRLGGKPRLMYADHPYVEGIVDGVTVNIVACYRVEPPEWLSATDRTPYHTRYVLERMRPEQRDEVRLLKGFMLGCRVYGAEIKIRGFSGYLAELLTLHYGTFLKTVEAAARWKIPVTLDPEHHYASEEEIQEVFPNQSLVVVDPVDRSRNVAAAVAEERLTEFILASKLFIKSPNLRFFQPKRVKSRLREVRKMMQGRSFLALLFKTGERKPPDVLWGELRRSEEGIKRALERLGFQVYRSGSWTDEEGLCLIIYELAYTSLPRVKLHRGPPIDNPNIVQFLDRWLGSGEAVAGPWVEGMRLYVLRRVDVVDAARALRREIREGKVALARGLAEQVARAKITTNLDLFIKDRRLLPYIAEFLSARPSFL